MTRGVLYYTDNQIGEPICSLTRKHILVSGLPITSASLAPIDFGDNAVIEGKRGYPTLVKQIISCLERSTAECVFFAEHDCLYPRGYWDFTPLRDDIFYYNENVWRWWWGSDTAIRHDRMLSLSGLCVSREFALDHYLKRQRMINERGWGGVEGKEPTWARRIGYEPGQKKKKRGGFSDDGFETWSSKLPVIDIRHK